VFQVTGDAAGAGACASGNVPWQHDAEQSCSTRSRFFILGGLPDIGCALRGCGRGWACGHGRDGDGGPANARRHAGARYAPPRCHGIACGQCTHIVPYALSAC
jgi:hypothetical protein